eukprot:PITA_22031
MVPVRKKNGDIRICIDFRNLNKASQKDNFPLPTMEQILHSVAGSELMSFLDGFSGYNQILVHPDDRLKTTFRTKWGTYAYQKMPFGLINAGATFQRAMDIAFTGLINKTVVVYLDDIIVFSKKRSNHLHDLKQIFERYRRRNYDSILLRCLEKPEAQKVLQELRDGPTRGHFGVDTTAHKIIHAGYYWPTLFRDTHEYVRKCQSFQISIGRQRKPAFPLQPVNIEQPFEQWGLDIIGEITPQSSKQHKHILTATDYFTKLVQAIPMKTTNSEAIIEFIDQFIITRFGVPNALIFDNASYFSGNSMFEFAIKRGFKLKYSVNYYPQGNGLAESTNKNLIKIIK